MPSASTLRGEKNPRPRDLQREETRRKVYECALHEFREKGFAAASIDEIVQRAAVSRGTFYFHFPSKEDVLLQLLGESKARVARTVERLPPGASIDMIFERVGTAIAAEWQGDARIFPDLAMVALRATSAVLPEESGDPVRIVLARRVARAIAEKDLFDTVPASMLSDLFLLNQFAVALAWSSQPNEFSLSDALHAASALFLHGAASRAPSTRK